MEKPQMMTAWLLRHPSTQSGEQQLDAQEASMQAAHLGRAIQLVAEELLTPLMRAALLG